MIIKNENVTSHTIVTFGSRMGTHIDNIKPYDFLKSLSGLGARLVFVSDITQTWYSKGITESNGVEHTIQILKEKVSGRVLFMGHSAGGYAAILFGSIINVNQILAFSPQLIRDELYWREFAPDKNLSHFIANTTAEITIAHCERCSNDLDHINPFTDYVSVVSFDCDSHNSAKYAIKKTDFLKSYIDDFMSPSVN